MDHRGRVGSSVSHSSLFPVAQVGSSVPPLADRHRLKNAHADAKSIEVPPTKTAPMISRAGRSITVIG